MKQIYYPGSLTEKELESIENLLQYLDELNHSYTRTENNVVDKNNEKKTKNKLNENYFGAIYVFLDTIEHG